MSLEKRQRRKSPEEHAKEVRRRFPTSDPPPGNVELALNFASSQNLLFQLVLDTFHESITIANYEGGMTYVNAEWVRQFQEPAEAFRGQRVSDWFRSRIRGVTRRSLMADLERGIGVRDLPVWLIRRTGERVSASLSVAPLLVEGVLVRSAFLFRDMTEIEHRQRELEEAKRQAEALARTDELTGLYNHRAFMEQLSHDVAACSRSGSELALAFIDPNGFKPINDEFGHETGNELIQEIARRIQRTARDGDFVARFGGDEFVVILAAPSEAGVKRACQRLSKALTFEKELRHPKTERMRRVRFTAAIGVAMRNASKVRSVEGLVRLADQAMYTSKQGHAPFVIDVR